MSFRSSRSGGDRVLAGEFPLRLDVHIARKGRLVEVDEGAAIEALAERAGARLLIDDPAAPFRFNAFILVSGVGDHSPV